MKILEKIADFSSKLKLVFQIAFYSDERNPLYKVAEIKRKKIENTYNKLLDDYKKELKNDHEEDEIEEQIMFSISYLMKKAEVICYDFTPNGDNTDDYTKKVNEVIKWIHSDFIFRFPFYAIALELIIIFAIIIILGV